MAAPADPVLVRIGSRRRKGPGGQVDPEAGCLRELVQERDQDAARSGAEIDDSQAAPAGRGGDRAPSRRRSPYRAGAPGSRGRGGRAGPRTPAPDDSGHRLMGQAPRVKEARVSLSSRSGAYPDARRGLLRGMPSAVRRRSRASRAAVSNPGLGKGLAQRSSARGPAGRARSSDRLDTLGYRRSDAEPLVPGRRAGPPDARSTRASISSSRALPAITSSSL